MATTWAGPQVLPRLQVTLEHPGGTAMHTRDLEHHDNLYADEVATVIGETPADAWAHAGWAIAVIAAMVVGLGISLSVL